MGQVFQAYWSLMMLGAASHSKHLRVGLSKSTCEEHIRVLEMTTVMCGIYNINELRGRERHRAEHFRRVVSLLLPGVLMKPAEHKKS